MSLKGSLKRIGGKVEGVAKNIGQSVEQGAKKVGRFGEQVAQQVVPGAQMIGNMLNRGGRGVVDSARSAAANSLRQVKRQAGGGQINFTTSEQI